MSENSCCSSEIFLVRDRITGSIIGFILGVFSILSLYMRSLQESGWQPKWFILGPGFLAVFLLPFNWWLRLKAFKKLKVEYEDIRGLKHLFSSSEEKFKVAFMVSLLFGLLTGLGIWLGPKESVIYLLIIQYALIGFGFWFGFKIESK